MGNNALIADFPVAPPIDFEPVQHVYTLNGVALPSVTQIMEPMSLMLYRGISPIVLAEAADRGTRAHEQVSNFVQYGVIETDEDTEQYIEAFKRFSEERKPVWVASEHRTYHKVMRYAGTVDLIGYIEPDTGEGVDVVDIKCTATYHPIMLATQVAAYAEALRSHGARIRNRYGLQLIKDGRYRLERVADGYKTFLHCLAITNEMSKESRP